MSLPKDCNVVYLYCYICRCGWWSRVLERCLMHPDAKVEGYIKDKLIKIFRGRII